MNLYIVDFPICVLLYRMRAMLLLLLLVTLISIKTVAGGKIKNGELLCLPALSVCSETFSIDIIFTFYFIFEFGNREPLRYDSLVDKSGNPRFSGSSIGFLQKTSCA